MIMQYCIFDNMNQCNEQEIARLLPLVSDQRRQQALAYKHLFGQFCCLKSYELLLQLLASSGFQTPDAGFSTPDTGFRTPDAGFSTPDTGCWTPDAGRPTFLYNEYGAPRLEHGPCFSISHCKNAIAVAISETPIGIDIEHIRIARPELVERTMNEAEQQQIWESDQPNVAFTRLWTRKEAVLKLQGTGIIGDIKNTLVALDNIDLQTKVNIDKQYAYTLAILR